MALRERQRALARQGEQQLHRAQASDQQRLAASAAFLRHGQASDLEGYGLPGPDANGFGGARLSSNGALGVRLSEEMAFRERMDRMRAMEEESIRRRQQLLPPYYGGCQGLQGMQGSSPSLQPPPHHEQLLALRELQRGSQGTAAVLQQRRLGQHGWQAPPQPA